ncbi:MAG: hypothetical protein J6K21_02605 [Bacilli bacterium]|nr:hypothetical protein [Bacilli bacterium]
MNEKIDIAINGNENSKSEIIYNNIMKELSKDEQVRYLKTKVTLLETEMKNKIISLLLFMVAIIGFGIGIYFLIIDLYLLGTLVILSTFIAVMIKFHLMYKSIIKVTHNMEFDKVEHLRKILDGRLK